ncbi:aminopeptidase, partial [Streptomyces rubiginosohelvolus]
MRRRGGTGVGRPRGATAAQPETAPGTTSTDTDIKDRLLAIPGMSLIEEKPYTGYRFFVLN